MLVPLAWLKDYVSLPASVAELIERLTLAGLECEGTRTVGVPVPVGMRVKPEDQTPVWEQDKVVVAKVLEISKVPGADKLKFVLCDYGAAEPKRVITGAPNIEAGQSGMLVILGLRGCQYFFQKKPEDPKTVVTLEPRKLMGHDNDAMCMSNFELGIAEDHDGIILLQEGDAKPGDAAQDLLGGVIVDLAVLPNMARCLSLLGVAREVAALTGSTVKEPEATFSTGATKAADACTVAIAVPNLSRRYMAGIIRNVTVQPAPLFMRTRLQAAGMRPISNVVDITNFVMLETGQPLHAFDYDVLKTRAGDKTPAITVRLANKGEVLKTLDGQVRELSSDDLVIADTVGAIALAGVMGGLDTEVTAVTKTILLESAHFDAVSIRKTARKFNLFSEASTRFSKGIHPDVADKAIRRACQLLSQFGGIGGGIIDIGIVDTYPSPLPPQVIDLPKAEISRVLGFTLSDTEVVKVLDALQFTVKANATGWTVTAPNNRLDIQVGAADLIEELARVSGYDKLPESLLKQEMPTPRENRTLNLEEHTRDILAGLGLQECVSYSLTSASMEDAVLRVKDVARVELLNPLSPERGVMRTSLLPELLVAAKRNLENAEGVSLFELGPVYSYQAEPQRLTLVLVGRKTVAAWDDPLNTKPATVDFYDLKGVVEHLTNSLALKVSFTRTVSPAHLHPGRYAELSMNGITVGTLGELHPSSAEAAGLAGRAVFAAELHLEELLKAVPNRVAYKPFSTHPPAKRDIAIIVPAETSADTVRAELVAAGGDLLTDASLFDVYTGDSIPVGTKSLAFALTYQAMDRTLADKEIDKAHQKIEGRLKHVLKAQIRGKE